MRRAFTLVELLMVIAILAVLMALLIPALGWVRFAARAATTTERMEGVAQAIGQLGLDADGPAEALHRLVIAPELQAQGRATGVLRFARSADSNESVPTSGGWIDTTVPWCLPTPWGREAMDATGAPAPPLARRLRDLSPLMTERALIAAAVTHAAGEWTGNRSQSVPWNDAWGHPLVVGLALYQPQANTAHQTRLTGHYVNKLVIRPDYYYERANTLYRYTRAVYIALAAAGPVLRTPLAGSVAADAPAIWTQAVDACDGDRWDETAFASPPWKGVARGSATVGGRRERCFLGAPIEVR